MNRTTTCNHRLLFALTLTFASPLLALAQSQPAEKPVAVTRENYAETLVEARKAMKAGNLAVADALIRRTEEAKLHFPVLYFGDKPAKARRDLSKLIRANSPGKNSTTKNPGTAPQNFLGRKSKAPLADPFVTQADYQDGGKPNPFRTAPNNASLSPSADRYAGTLLGGGENQSPRAISDFELLSARRALAVGDAARALQHLERAQQQNVSYEPTEDSPQRIGRSIRDCQQLTADRAEKSGDPTWRQGYAKFLLAQAEALVQWSDLEAAERAASEATQLHVTLVGNGNTAENTLRRIQQMRRGEITPNVQIDRAPTNLSQSKRQTMELLAEARTTMSAGDLDKAEKLIGAASRLNVSDSQFAPHEDRPAKLALELQQTRMQQGTVKPASSNEPVLNPPTSPVQLPLPDIFTLEEEPRVAQAPPIEFDELPSLEEAIPTPSEAFEQMRQGEQALRSGDRAGALELFQEAYQHRSELDLTSQQQLQGHLQMLSAKPRSAAPRTTTPAGGSSLLSGADSGSQVLARQLSADVGKRQSDAARIRSSNPNQALDILQEARSLVDQSKLDDSTKTQLLRRVDLSLVDTRSYIRDHQAEIELDDTNLAILEEIDRERAVKVQVSQRIANMVDQYNTLRDEQRYAEMEVVAKRLYDMAPNEPIARQTWNSAKFIRRTMLNQELADLGENGIANALLDLKRTGAEASRDSLKDFGYGDDWPDRVKNRKGSRDISHRRSPRELEIQQRLRTEVLPNYDAMPLSQVIDVLSELAGVNIHLDPRGLSQEGVRSDAPIDLHLSHAISLESALNLILEPLHLTFMIKDEVLKITSEQLRDGDVYPVTYYVTDLVVPIPDFTPNAGIGLQGLIEQSYSAMGHGPQTPGFSGPVAMVAGNNPGQSDYAQGGNALAQQFGAGNTAAGGSVPMGGGPAGQGGAASADFDSLIDLIISTVENESWMENGTGDGEIQPYPGNFSLVISQTQRVHEQIADLLDQLRSLQDLQVTIEVRFIRLTDNFFERIGIDFDMNIEDGSGITDLTPGASFEPSRASATVGLNPDTSLADFPSFTASLDVPFRQESFGLAVPQIGGQQSIGSFGFAILSDIEAYFIINASQGDQRSNVLEAPKVTMFNGQQAIILDTAFVPFVISVIPVVGEFAAAQQPVIVVLSQGTQMTVRAVVSDDRRYVRLTLVPFFSQIGDVRTFTFDGSETSSSSSSTDEDDDGNPESDDVTETVRSGTTVQLPTFEVISIATTVSVPDGGTVLLGGIKRLSEGRNEFGIPLLSKIPYIDRLFRNVGIGRSTESLMMMVTPHIIIQEEEEEKLGIAAQ